MDLNNLSFKSDKGSINLTKIATLLAITAFVLIVTNFMIRPKSVVKVLNSTKTQRKLFNFSYDEHVQFPDLPRSLNSTTVVSIYIELTKSKHSVNDYDNWIRKFAHSVTSPLAIIVNNSSYAKLKHLRRNSLTKFYMVEDVWSVMKQLELERNNSYIENYKSVQNEIDGERAIHNANLYAIWNLKSFVVNLIARENPFNSSFFIYADAGSFRDEPKMPVWPDTEFINDELMPYLNDRILLGQINGFSGKLNENTDLIEGTWFCGSTKAVRDFYANFYSIHDGKFFRGMFVGKDQTTMNLLAFKYFKETAVRLQVWSNGCPNGDPWFFFQNFLSAYSKDFCNLNRLDILLMPGEMDIRNRTSTRKL
jgi:hypothetical protein